MAKGNPNDINVVTACLGILNSILHIFESILSQEELPDFYEENLENIASILSFIIGGEAEYPQF